MTAGSKPALFIGSSSEGLDFARAVRSLLAQDAEVTLWNEGFFLVGDTFIDSLVNPQPFGDYGARPVVSGLLASGGKTCSWIAGPNWEVYGHWQPEWDADPSLIRTDVFYQVT
jgi:hypothetical protein